VSMSDVVIKSTENGPNLVIVNGKAAQPLVQALRIHPHALLRLHTQEKRIQNKNTRSQSPLEERVQRGFASHYIWAYNRSLKAKFAYSPLNRENKYAIYY